MVNIGTFDRKVALIGYIDGVDDLGANVRVAMQPISTWARIEGLRGREYYDASKVKDVDLYKISIRYRKNVTSDMRVHYKEHVFEIQYILDPYMAHQMLELYCIEKTRGGRP